MLTARRHLCLIIGDPVAHSISPAVHHAGFQALGIEDEFVYAAARVPAGRTAEAAAAARVLGLRGLTCTMPHKEAILSHLDRIDPEAALVGAVNTVVQEEGALHGFNTDVDGLRAAVGELREPRGAAVVILGAGGTGRAAALMLARAGARVTVLNRSIERAGQVAAACGGEAGALEAGRLTDADIIINTLPAAAGSIAGELGAVLTAGQGVVEVNYAPLETPLTRAARARGARVVSGAVVFLHQALRQFELYTGRSAPAAAMRAAVDRAVGREECR